MITIKSLVVTNSYQSQKKTPMKKVIKIFPLALLSCLLLIGCSKSSVTPADNAANPSVNLITGNWIVSSFTQKTEDKTSQFSGIIFNFSDGGKLTASQNGSVTTGTWSHSPSSVGYYGSAPTKASISINMGASKTMKNITKTWNVISSDSTKLSLINPEPLEDEHLVFSKQ